MAFANDLLLKVRRLDEKLELPAYAHVGDAALDLRAAEDFSLEPFERKSIPTGIAIELPEGYAALVTPRSGLAVKQGITVLNAPGLIDGNYRGEICAILMNMDPRETFHAKRGDRIAQLLLIPFSTAKLELVEVLGESNRGQAGFGSSGIA